jgi:hypothetical protein
MGPDAEKLLPMAAQVWKQRGAAAMGLQLEAITRKIDPMDDDSIGRAARDLHRFVIERDDLDASAEGRDAAVAAVYEILVDFVPGITADQVARAMSGIGIYSELSDDDIEVILRDQKAQLLKLQQIKAWRQAAIDEAKEKGSGKGPPPTGRQHAEKSDEQRALERINNEAKKASGISNDAPGALKSALDAAKRMARNRIADLTKALKPGGERIPKSQKVLRTDAELDALREERDRLQKLYDEAWGRPGLSDEQRLNAAEKALDRAIANMEADLQAGKLYPDAPKAPMTSPAIEAKRAELEALKASREEMRIQSGEADARSDAAYERHLLERSAELTRRLAEKDFMPAAKKPPREKTTAMLRLERSIHDQKQALNKLRRAWEFKKRHIVYKAMMRGPVAVFDIIRKGLTTWDQSLIGRQGIRLGGSHPIIYARAIAKAWSNPLKTGTIFTTAQELFDVQAKLDADEHWTRMEKIGKLAVTDVHGGMRSEEGNEWVPEWVNKIPGVGGSERAGSAFINTQRRLVFRSLVEQLATDLDGKRSISNAELRVVGNIVNASSGRGSLWKFENVAHAASMVFFSPKWWASRIALLTGQPIWAESKWFGGEGASPEVRKLVAKEMLKQTAAQMAILGLTVAGLMAAFGDPGDDEEWDFYWDPRSPDFGKIRIGQTMVDMTAGLGQHASLVTRMFGTEVRRWEGPTDAKTGSIMLTYGRGKLAPIPGMVADFLSDNGKSMSGETAGTLPWYVDKLGPLILQDVVKTSDEEGIPVGPVLSLLMFFGIGAQTRDERIKARGDAANEIRAMRKRGASPEKIQEALNDHLKHTAGLEAKEDLRTADPEDAAALESVVSGSDSPAMTDAVQKEKHDIALRALEMLSTEDRKGDKKSGEDAGITTARSLLKEIAPTFEEAEALFKAAYKQRNGSLTELVGPAGAKRFKKKESVAKAQARLRAIYGKH